MVLFIVNKMSFPGIEQHKLMSEVTALATLPQVLPIFKVITVLKQRIIRLAKFLFFVRTWLRNGSSASVSSALGRSA